MKLIEVSNGDHLLTSLDHCMSCLFGLVGFDSFIDDQQRQTLTALASYMDGVVGRLVSAKGELGQGQHYV